MLTIEPETLKYVLSPPYLPDLSEGCMDMIFMNTRTMTFSSQSADGIILAEYFAVEDTLKEIRKILGMNDEPGKYYNPADIAAPQRYFDLLLQVNVAIYFIENHYICRILEARSYDICIWEDESFNKFYNFFNRARRFWEKEMNSKLGSITTLGFRLYVDNDQNTMLSNDMDLVKITDVKNHLRQFIRNETLNYLLEWCSFNNNCCEARLNTLYVIGTRLITLDLSK